MVTETAERERLLVPADIDKYRGQWVAIKRAEVVASADTPTKVLRLVEEGGITGWVLDHVPDNPDTIFIL
jgi:hypothetical protein